MTPVSFFADTAESATTALDASVSIPCSAVCQTTPQELAGPRLTDAQREAAIQLAGKAIERHMAAYQRTNCFSDLGNADRARLSMEALIKGRSAEQVARMEAALGLGGAVA